MAVALATTCAGLVSGCGGSPSDGNIKAPIDRQIAADVQELATRAGPRAALLAKDAAPQVQSVKKVGCRDDADQTYVCDVEMVVVHRGTTTRTAGRFRLIKLGEVWDLRR